MLREIIAKFNNMLGVEKRVIENTQPDWIHDGKVPTDVPLDYDLLTDILPSKAHCLIYEELSGIKIPAKYKAKYDKEEMPQINCSQL